jgi:hypothetical protein
MCKQAVLQNSNNSRRYRFQSFSIGSQIRATSKSVPATPIARLNVALLTLENAHQQCITAFLALDTAGKVPD